MSPHLHLHNATKRAISTLKCRIIASTCTYNTRSLVSYWYKIIPQVTIILNLLRSSRRNLSLSTHTAIASDFNFNTTSLAPQGTKVVVHHKKRKTYVVYSLDGWYVGPSLEHYIYHHCFIPSTGGNMNADTFDFPPEA